MTSLLLRRARSFSLPSCQKWYSRVAVPLTNPIELPADRSPETRSPPEDIKISKVNGYTVASVENYSSLSNVSVFVRAGSRYESYTQQGLTHLLRKCAFLGNDDRSALRISRETDLIGGSLDVASTREHLIYSSSFLRGNLVQIMDTLGSVVSYQKFKSWEVHDTLKYLPLDVAQAESCPTSVVLEGVHQIAYRNSLCNPLFCPPRNFSKFTSDDLQSYVKDYFHPEATVIVGVGMGHEELTRCVKNSFSSDNASADTPTAQAEYVGGSELRIPSKSDLTYAAVVCKGASRKGAQTDLLAAGILQHILGAEPHGYIKWGSNTSARLSKAGGLVTDNPFSVSVLNINYSDSGLFGIYIISQPNDAEKLLKATMKDFSDIARGNVSEADIAKAKNQLKTRYVMSTEAQATLTEDIGNQVNIKGAYSPIDKTLALVDSVTKDDIIRFSRAGFATKASYVTHGDLSSTPRLDHLLTEVSLR